MKIFTPDALTRYLLFALACFFIMDLLVYALKEWRRIGRIDSKGMKTKGVFTNIRSELVKRKMKSTADLAYTDHMGKEIRYLWQKGFFDEEVLLFRNTDKKKLDVTVCYDPDNSVDMYVEECYNRKKHLLVMILCVISSMALLYCLFIV